jgi:hypothetical protein
LPALHKGAQRIKVCGPIFFEPLQERAGIVERGVNAGVLFEKGDEGLVGFLVAIGENVVEVAAGLMCVDKQSQMELGRYRRGRHGRGRLSLE